MLEVNERIQFGKTFEVKGTVQREFRPPVFFIIHCPIGLNIFEFDHTARRFEKIRISQWKWNHIQNYFNLLVSGPGWFEWWKKTRGRNSRWTVPLSYAKQVIVVSKLKRAINKNFIWNFNIKYSTNEQMHSFF